MICQQAFLARRSVLWAVTTTLALFGAVGSAHADSTRTVEVQDFNVFVDMPTGFAFVKTPSGWRFVRQIEASRLGELHPSTLVSVSQPADRGTQVGQRLGQPDERVVGAAAIVSAF